MDILLIAHFCSDFDGKGNNRFNYIADLLANTDSNVELVTSDFSHTRKIKRNGTVEKYKYKVTLISEPGYSNNVSLKRFYSHYIMGRNLKKYLKTRKKPDVIYCAVPSLNLAKIAAEYSLKNNIRFIIDIQDLWPEAFKMVFNYAMISDVLFYPMRRKADYIYAAADEIIAVSETYKDRALIVNNKCKQAHSFYLGTELSTFDILAKSNKLERKLKDEIWLTYIGTLGCSYDLTCVIDALHIVKEQGIKNIKFVIMGDGPLKSKFENYAKEKNINAKFMGRLDYAIMAGVLKSCDIAVNPIKKGSAGSIINKVGDYAAAGLPVVNTQESEEYRQLLSDYNAGISCKNGDIVELAEAIKKLALDDELRRTMGNNNRKLAVEKFDRGKAYRSIVEAVRNL